MTKTYKMTFLTTMMLSTLISVSSYSWLGMWMGLEMNLLSIIPLMQNQKNILATESTIKYFIVQALASTIMLASIVTMMMEKSMTSNIDSSILSMSMNSALLTKMGMAPFHFWFPEVMEGLNWLNCLLILTWQKIAPMVLLMYNMKSVTFMSTIIIASMVISGVLGMTQVSLRKIMAYSSINHMGWMLSMMMTMQTIWTTYFLIYTLTSVNIVMILKAYNTFYLTQLYQTMNESITPKIFFMLNFMSLSGIPPLLGFMPKWLTIQALLANKMMLMPTIMIIFTVMMIFTYMRITLSTFLMNSSMQNWITTNKINKFKYMYMSTMNFVTISSLIFITAMTNMT